MKLVQVPILALALLLSASRCLSNPFVVVSTSVSSSSSSSSSSSNDDVAAGALDDSLAVEGRNVKIVRRIRVRTTTTPAPPTSTEFKETPEALEWFALKHKEFERVKNGGEASTTTTTESSVNRQSAASGSVSALSEAEYIYEFSDTSNGPRVQVIYGDGKTPPPAGLMESPDMINLIREHLHENSNGVEQVPSTQSPPPQPSAPITAAVSAPQPTQQPLSPQDILLPPIYHVGGGSVAVPVTPAPATAVAAAPAPVQFFSPYHGSAYTPDTDTETKTYVRSMPPVYTQPTSVTMPPMQVPGVRATSAWKWPTYIEEQQTPFKNFDYNFPTTFTTTEIQESPSPNYYPAELPFSPYEEPVYSKPPVASTQYKSRPDSSPNSIPWKPLPPSPSSSFSSSAYQKTKINNSNGNTVADSQVVAESSHSRGVEPGTYSTLGKRMTAPDMTPPLLGQYSNEHALSSDGFQDSAIKESHAQSHYVDVDSFSPASAASPSGEDYSSSSGENEYSNYIMDSGPGSSDINGYHGYEVSGFGAPSSSYSSSPFPVEMYSHAYTRAPIPGPPSPPSQPPKTMYIQHPAVSVSSAYPAFVPMPMPSPSLPTFYNQNPPGPPPPPPRHYKIMYVKPPESNFITPTTDKNPSPAPTLVYMMQEAPRAGPTSPSPAPTSSVATLPATAPSMPQLYYITSGNYKKRSAA